MLGNSSILYILLSWKIALSDLHILAPVVVQPFQVWFLMMSEWYLFLWINEFSPSSFLFIQSWTKISRQIYSGMDIILQNILFCSKGSSRFHKFMFALYHIFSAPLQAMLCGRHTNIIAWKIECLKIWPRHYGLEGEGEVWR